MPKSSLNLIPFTLFFSILAITGLHGANILKMGIILYINYMIAKRVGNSPKSGPVLTWTFNAAILFLNETYDGYQFASLSNHLSFLVRLLPIWASAKHYLMSISRITVFKAHTLVGTYYSTLLCYVSYRLIWTTIGPATHSRSR